MQAGPRACRLCGKFPLQPHAQSQAVLPSNHLNFPSACIRILSRTHLAFHNAPPHRPHPKSATALTRCLFCFTRLALGTWASPVAKGRVSFLKTHNPHYNTHRISNYGSAALGTFFDQMITRSFAASLHLRPGHAESSAEHHTKHPCQPNTKDGLKRRIKTKFSNILVQPRVRRRPSANMQRCSRERAHSDCKKILLGFISRTSRRS